jgi:hypothetical protein
VSYTSWSKRCRVQLYPNTVWVSHILYRGPVREHRNSVYYKSYRIFLPVYTLATFSFSPIYWMLRNVFFFSVTVDIFKVSAFEAELVMYPQWMLHKKQDESRFVAFFCVEVFHECSRRDWLSCWPSEMQPWGICLLAYRTRCLIWSFVVFWLQSMKFDQTTCNKHFWADFTQLNFLLKGLSELHVFWNYHCPVRLMKPSWCTI